MIRAQQVFFGLALGGLVAIAASQATAGPPVGPVHETAIPIETPFVLKSAPPIQHQVGFDVVVAVDPGVLTESHQTMDELCPAFAISISEVAGKTTSGLSEYERLGSGAPSWLSASGSANLCDETFTDIPGGVPLSISVTYSGPGSALTIGPTFVSNPTTLGANEPKLSYTGDVYREFDAFVQGAPRMQPTK